MRSELFIENTPGAAPRNLHIRLRIVLAMVLLLCMMPDFVYAGVTDEPQFDPAKIRRAFIDERFNGNMVLLEVVLDRPVEPVIFVLEDPARVVVDVPSAYNHMLPGSLFPRRTVFVGRVRLGYHPDEGLNRFVFDLAGNHKGEASYFLYTPSEASPQMSPDTRLLIKVVPCWD